MVSQQLHYVSGIISFEEYDPVIANDTYNQAACSDVVPIIFDFNPKDVAAGIGDVIFIRGLNFDGTNEGKVIFRDADEENELYDKTLSVDILDWKDTLIEVRVPSVLEDFGVAGTGKVGVEKFNSLSTLSDKELNVKYAITNTINAIDDSPYRVNLIDQNNNGGYTFLVDTFLYNQPAILACMNQALLDWSCETGVTWEIGGSIDNGTDAIDGENIIYWAPDTLLAATFTFGERAVLCENNNNEDVFYMTDIDMRISSTTNWNFDCTLDSVPPGEFDFYSTFLHELGHAHMIDHALPLPKLMYPVANPNEKQTFATEDIDAGLDVMDYSNDFLTPDCPEPNDPGFPTGCVNSTEEIGVPTNERIKVYPNPFDNQLTVEIDFETVEPITINIFDSLGRKVSQSKLNGGSKHQIEFGDRLSSGIYFVQVQHGTNVLNQTILKH